MSLFRKRSPRSNDEIHAKLQFVDADNSDAVLKTITVSGKQGETLYDALGKKTPYDLILDDYPAYLKWDADDPDIRAHIGDTDHYWNAIDQSATDGGFSDTADGQKAKAIYEQWRSEYDRGEHPLFDKMPVPNNNRNLTNDNEDVKVLSGNITLENNQTYTVKLTNNENQMLAIPAYSDLKRPINYYKYPNSGSNTAWVDMDAIGYAVQHNNNPGIIPSNLALAASQHRYVTWQFIIRDYQNASEPNPGMPTGNTQDQVNNVTYYLEFPKETNESRAYAEEHGDLQDWTTLDPLVGEISKASGSITRARNGYYTDQDGNMWYVDASGHRDKKHPDQADVVYYQNRHVSIRYVDVTDPNHKILLAGENITNANASDYLLGTTEDHITSDQSNALGLTTKLPSITLKQNGRTNPHMAHWDPTTQKMVNDSTAVPNTDFQLYNTSDNPVDNNTGYQQSLSKLSDKSYIFVKADFDNANLTNLEYNKADLKPVVFTVEVRRIAKKNAEPKTA